MDERERRKEEKLKRLFRFDGGVTRKNENSHLFLRLCGEILEEYIEVLSFFTERNFTLTDRFYYSVCKDAEILGPGTEFFLEILASCDSIRRK